MSTLNAWTLISNFKFPATFSINEIGEYFAEKYYADIWLKFFEKEWKENQSNHAQLMSSELGENYIYELKRKLLAEKYEQVIKDIYQAKSIGEDTKKYDAQKNALKFAYELHAYRPDYQNKTFTKEQIQQADEIDIKNFIKTDTRGFVPCPFHKEKTASMHITKNKWYCFGCGEKGKTIKFIMKYYNLDFQQAIKKLLNL